MTLTIEVTEEEQGKLEAGARRTGSSSQEYAVRLLRERLVSEPRDRSETEREQAVKAMVAFMEERRRKDRGLSPEEIRQWRDEGRRY